MMSISLLLSIESIEVRGNLEANYRGRVICEVQCSGFGVHAVSLFSDLRRAGDKMLEEQLCTRDYRGEGATRHVDNVKHSSQ